MKKDGIFSLSINGGVDICPVSPSNFSYFHICFHSGCATGAWHFCCLSRFLLRRGKAPRTSIVSTVVAIRAQDATLTFHTPCQQL